MTNCIALIVCNPYFYKIDSLFSTTKILSWHPGVPHLQSHIARFDCISTLCRILHNNANFSFNMKPCEY